MRALRLSRVSCVVSLSSRIPPSPLHSSRNRLVRAAFTHPIVAAVRSASQRAPRTTRSRASSSALKGRAGSTRATSRSRGELDSKASTVRPSAPLGTSSQAVKKRRASSPSVHAPRRTQKDTDSEEEHRMAENDTRLAMRMLMSRHLSREAARHKPEERRREMQREALRRAQSDRLKRLEEKTQNSIALLGADADTVGDGVLPYFMHDGHAPPPPPTDPHAAATAAPTHSTAAPRAPPAWLRPNMVTAGSATAAAVSGAHTAGAWFDDELEGAAVDVEPTLRRSTACAVSLDRLCKPDLSVYDSAFDQRISSADVLARERELSRLKRDAGVVFESDDAEDDVRTMDAGHDDDDASKADEEMSQLIRTTSHAEDADGTAALDAADPPMALYQVSRRTAAQLRAQLRAEEEENEDDGMASISPYEADPDDDEWVA